MLSLTNDMSIIGVIDFDFIAITCVRFLLHSHSVRFVILCCKLGTRDCRISAIAARTCVRLLDLRPRLPEPFCAHEQSEQQSPPRSNLSSSAQVAQNAQNAQNAPVTRSIQLIWMLGCSDAQMHRFRWQ